MRAVFVNTPKGRRQHGAVDDNNTFVREVKTKDLMRIYDAWSINPDVLEKLPDMKVDKLEYRHGTHTYSITTADAVEHGFIRTHGGGRTVYIPRKWWTKTIK